MKDKVIHFQIIYIINYPVSGGGAGSKPDFIDPYRELLRDRIVNLFEKR